jgi:hypothetical protein
MPGQVPLSNAKFLNSPDFNNQTISGITGSGVFRQFSYISSGSTSRTIANSDLWAMVQLSGNSLVTIPAGISANAGDEILVINSTGTISFTTSGGATLLSSSLYSIPAERPARLIYAGSNNWILAGAKTAYTSNAATDCCNANLDPVYTFGDFSTSNPAYSNQYGTALYTFSGLGGSVVIGSSVYNINSGIITASACSNVSFNVAYTFYNSSGNSSTVYSYVSINILSNDVIGVPFKTLSESNIFACDTASALAPGTYYRAMDIYGTVLYPVCINSSGIAIATTACP